MLDTEKIRELREIRGLSQSEAASAADGKGRQWWHNIESGLQTNITLDTLEKIAKALQCEPHDLLKKAERPKKRAGR